MHFSAKLDDLQQRAHAKAAAQAAVSESREQLRQRIDQAKVDVDLAAKDARQQVGEAADAIEFAAWTVDHARLAVLDAIDARVYADQLAQQSAR